MLAGLGRAAAVLVISVGLGFGAGRLAGVGRSIAPAQITADAALDAIGFGLIEDPSSTGLLNDILPAPDAEGTQ